MPHIRRGPLLFFQLSPAGLILAIHLLFTSSYSCPGQGSQQTILPCSSYSFLMIKGVPYRFDKVNVSILEANVTCSRAVANFTCEPLLWQPVRRSTLLVFGHCRIHSTEDPYYRHSIIGCDIATTDAE